MLAPFRGKPLVRHAAETLLQIPFTVRLIACAGDAIETPDGFERVYIDPGLPQSASVKAGIEALKKSTSNLDRHCEECNDEAIHEAPISLDCFAPLAMTSGADFTQSARASFDIDAVLIALADMPGVPADHFKALLAAFDPASGNPIASGWAGSKPMPPAVFGRSQWPELVALEGDQGARYLLRDARVILADRAALIDVDVKGDLR